MGEYYIRLFIISLEYKSKYLFLLLLLFINFAVDKFAIKYKQKIELK